MDFKKFWDSNRKEIFKLADKNTLKDAEGRTIIPKDDEWLSEDEYEWENHPPYTK